jgi:hypothetical protein
MESQSCHPSQLTALSYHDKLELQDTKLVRTLNAPKRLVNLKRIPEY